MNKDFLQSNEWVKFQESVGRKTFLIEDENFYAQIIEHELPIVGKPACIAKRSIAGRYFYVPRGPIVKDGSRIKSGMTGLVELAKKERAGWIRVEPKDLSTLEIISENQRVVKAPHDMQPREIFVIDIDKSEEELLAGMKAKTRYNIKLAQKRSVSIHETRNTKHETRYIEEFLRLTNVMAKRQGITAHPENYYRKMLEVIPEDMLKLYVAEYNGRVVAANLVVFYGDTAIYLHGASDDEYRNMMAPFLLQWQAILDAKKRGCRFYDLGGVKTTNSKSETLNSKQIPNSNDQNSKRDAKNKTLNTERNSWQGITRFKMGFSPETKPVEFPGSYDIIINLVKYRLYRSLQWIKRILRR